MGPDAVPPGTAQLRGAKGAARQEAGPQLHTQPRQDLLMSELLRRGGDSSAWEMVSMATTATHSPSPM